MSSHPIDTAVPLLSPIQGRWSPRAFADRPIPEASLLALLEAARWAPSCFNEQPWRLVVAARATEPDAFALLAALLNERNRQWAARAPVLMLTVAQTLFRHNGSPNRHAWHDVGQAVAQMAVQAAAEGIQLHQMAGFDRDAAPARLGLPAGVEPVAMVAMGYPDDPDQLPADLAARERAPRQRLPLSSLVFTTTWGQAR